MDEYEATKIVLSRIKSLDPENASRIMGLLLIQDNSEKELIRLAFGPETLIQSVIVKAKKELGLMKCPRSLNPASLPFYSNGGRSSRDLPNDFELMDDVNPRTDFLGSVHARSGSCVLDGLGYGGDSDLGFVGVPCSYFARGFCKNGASCRFVHTHGGADLVGSSSRIELLRSNSVPPRLAHHFMTSSSLPSFPPKGVNLHLSEAQRAAALMIADEMWKLGKLRPDRIELSAMDCPASRQIYLTFPAESRFREEDVHNYFSNFGPVQDVRIPYQQKRMFGFVTFVYPETVKGILAKGNPHFVRDSRVLVKPYREKGKLPDQFRTIQTKERDLSPTGLDSSPGDILGRRGFYNNTQDVSWRSKFEEDFLELQSKRLMNLQLLDDKKHRQINSPTHIHSQNHFSQSLISPRPLSVIKRENEGGEKGKGISKEGSDDDVMNLTERLEDSLPYSLFTSTPAHLLFGESSDNNGSNLWSSSSDNDDHSTPIMSESFNSMNCQMPRLLQIGMLPGRDGPTCRVGI